MAYSQISIKTTWGGTIYGNAWTVDKGEPVANVVISHGMGEYSFRYDEFAKFLNSIGYNVYAVDQPGHGLNVTIPEVPELGLGVWPDNGFKLACSYLFELITQVNLSMKPTILLGHSMGSFVAQRYYQRFNATIDGLILSGSSANNLSYIFGRRMARLMSHFIKKDKRKRPSRFFSTIQRHSFNRFVPKFKDGYKTHHKWLSTNEDTVKKFDTDPLCGFDCSFNYYYNLFNGLKPTFQKARVKAITHRVDILLVSGDKDPVGSRGRGVKKLAKFFKKCDQNVEMKLYSGKRHEILFEDEETKKVVYDDIATFLAKCVSDSSNQDVQSKHRVSKDLFAD